TKALIYIKGIVTSSITNTNISVASKKVIPSATTSNSNSNSNNITNVINSNVNNTSLDKQHQNEQLQAQYDSNSKPKKRKKIERPVLEGIISSQFNCFLSLIVYYFRTTQNNLIL